MRESEFLDLLRYYFRNAKPSEVKEILADYEAHFEEGKKEGLTEEEISKELGSPKDIYDSYQSEGVVDEKTKTSTLMDGAEKAANAAGKAADAAQKKLGETWDEVSPKLPQAVESTALLTARLLYGAGIVLAVFIAAATILILDPESEFTKLVEALGGQVVKVSATSDNHLNAMDMDAAYGNEKNPLIEKSEFILSVFEQLFSALAVLFTGIEGSKALQSTVKKDDHKEEGGEGK